MHVFQGSKVSHGNTVGRNRRGGKVKQPFNDIQSQ